MSIHTVTTVPSVGVWEIDPAHSSMHFTVRHHAVSSFRAGFYPMVGRFDAKLQSLTGEVRAEDVQVPMDSLRRHLQREEFFDSERYPLITFASTSIEATDSALQVTGDLTLKGVTRQLTATGAATAPVLVRHPDQSEADHFGIDLSATIDRRDYGVSYNNELPAGILNLGWEVRLEIALELIQTSEQ